jgi:histidinol-phosphate aminotransferase
MSKHDFDAFVDFVTLNRPDVIIIADDSDPEFRERRPEDNYPEPSKHVIAGKNIVHIQTFSHIFGMTGLRLGYYIAPVHIKDKLETRRIYRGVSNPAIAGGIASIENADEQIDRSYLNNHEGRLWLYSCFEQMGLPYLKSQGAYVMVNAGRQASTVYILMAAQGVMIRQGCEWDMDTWIRVNPGLHPVENEKFINAFKNTCRKSGSSTLKDVLNTPEGIQGLKNGFSQGMLPDMSRFTNNDKITVLRRLNVF